jgi:hypothetical protein
VLDNDEEAQRCRALPPRLHPLGAVADVPALEAGPPRKAHIAMSLDGGGFCLEADRAGFRFLGRVFEEIASSSLESGWRFARDGRFRASDEGAPFAFRLVDPV